MADRSDYMAVDEATTQLGVSRGTFYYYVRTLELKTKKFPLDRRAYLLKADFERIKMLKEDAKRSNQPEVAFPPAAA